MNRWIKASLAVIVAATGLAASQVSGISPVSADNPACPSVHYSAPFWTWTRSDFAVYGVRAPVEMRIDGLLCSPPSAGPFAAAWIAIQQQSGSGITQIGFVHLYDANGDPAWTRFWAIGSGVGHFYDIGGTSDFHYVFFMIDRYFNPVNHAYYYAIKDCGEAGGYGSCTVKSDTQLAYNDPEGVVAAETNYGCTVQIMGSASAPTHYGTSANPVEGLVDVWATRTWSDKLTEGDCTSDYQGNQVTGGMVTWDSRN